MRGKKYKAKDRAVQKAGRGGLMEINLHSHEQKGISSREKENAVRKAPDPVNYQKTRGRERSAGSEKRKRRRRAAVPGDQSGADSNAEGVRQDYFKLPETSGGRQFFETSGMGSAQGRVPEPCRMQTGTVPDTDEKTVQIDEMGDASRAGLEMTAGYETCRPLAGMAVRDVEGQRHGGTVRPGLKYDAAYYPSPGRYGNAGGTETEKAARFREDAQGNDMDAQDAHGRFSDAGGRPIQHIRGSSIQRAFFPPGMDSRRKRPDSGRKIPWKKKQRIIFSSGEKAGTEPAENGALKDEAGRAGSAAGDLENAGARKHGRLEQDGNKRKRTCKRDARLDIFSGESCPEKGKSTAVSSPAVPDGVRKIPLGKKQRIYFSSGEQAGTGPAGNGVLKNTAGREAGRTGAAAGDKKGSDSRKGTDVKKDRPPDSAGTGNPEHGRTERGGKKKGGRLYFDEKDSGMVRGAGMGIAKRTARAFLHAVDESGSVCTDEDDESETVQKRIRKNRMAGAAASGLRHAVGSRSSRMAGYRQRMERCSRSMPWAAGGTGAGRGRHPDMDSPQGKNSGNAEQETKKTARRKQQKKRYKRIYQSHARTGMWKAAKQTAGILQPGPAGNAKQAAGRKRHAFFEIFGKKKNMQWLLAAVFILFLSCASMFASCSALFQGAAGIVGTTYPGSDEDIQNTEARYLELENALDSQVNGMEAAHPGYDEYRYQIDGISHDPYRLASYLTVVCPGYTYEQAESMLQDILERQYRLTVEERTETRIDPDTGESVEWHVLCISLENRGLDAVAHRGRP